ncbi:MAG: PLP-dependent aminotransferase family protein [Lachnospiraceae bacterium]
MNELMINLKSNGNTPLYEQIYSYIKQDIQKGHIPCKEKLPSTRSLAKHLEVSRSTVELAYEQLLSEGYIESVPCKGFFVSQIESLYPFSTIISFDERKVEEHTESYLYDFTPNGIDLNSFPYRVWRKISRDVLLDDKTELFKLGDSQGEYEFRKTICNYLHQARGVNCNPEQVIIGAGNEYLLMLLNTIIGSGQKIAFENPTYKRAYKLFQNLSHEVYAVDMDSKGMNITTLMESGANMAYVMPSHQYPLGIVMPIQRRLELLKWAAKEERRYIIEDDYDSEFRYKGKPIPALQGYDANDKVIYLGTFSKAIAPAIRMSYMVIPKRLLNAYQKNTQFLSSTVSKVDQYIVETFMKQGYYERHLNKLRAMYKSRHDKLLSCLKQLQGKCRISGEHAGVHLLLSFSNDNTEEELIYKAQKVGVKVYGLSEYYAKQDTKKSPTILLGYANISEDEIEKAVQLLAQAWI